MPVQIIEVNKRVARLGNKLIMLQDINNQIAMMLYGKTCTSGDAGILGEAQQIRNPSALMLNTYEIHLPSQCVPDVTWFQKRPSDIETEFMDNRELTKRYNHLRSMIKHAATREIKIRIVNV